MKNLAKVLFICMFAFTIYLNNGDIIVAKKLESKWTWTTIKDVKEYREKQPNLTSYKIRDVKNLKNIKVPITSILRIEED